MNFIAHGVTEVEHGSGVIHGPEANVAVDVSGDGNNSGLHPFGAVGGNGAAGTLVRLVCVGVLHGEQVAIDVEDGEVGADEGEYVAVFVVDGDGNDGGVLGGAVEGLEIVEGILGFFVDELTDEVHLAEVPDEDVSILPSGDDEAKNGADVDGGDFSPLVTAEAGFEREPGAVVLPDPDGGIDASGDEPLSVDGSFGDADGRPVHVIVYGDDLVDDLTRGG